MLQESRNPCFYWASCAPETAWPPPASPTVWADGVPTPPVPRTATLHIGSFSTLVALKKKLETTEEGKLIDFGVGVGEGTPQLFLEPRPRAGFGRSRLAPSREFRTEYSGAGQDSKLARRPCPSPPGGEGGGQTDGASRAGRESPSLLPAPSHWRAQPAQAATAAPRNCRRGCVSQEQIRMKKPGGGGVTKKIR